MSWSWDGTPKFTPELRSRVWVWAGAGEGKAPLCVPHPSPKKGATGGTQSSAGTTGIILGTPQELCQRRQHPPCQEKWEHCSKRWRKTHSRWFFLIKTKTLQALQPQHQHRELWALMKRAWLNYPTAPGMSRPGPGVTAAPELSYKTLAASGGLAGIFLFSVPPSKQTQTQSQGCHAGFAPASLEARAGGCLNSCPFTLKHAENRPEILE